MPAGPVSCLVLGILATAAVHAATPLVLYTGPVPTPDGSAVVFEAADDLWLASTETGEARRIVGSPGRDAYPRVTPDGKRIIFSSDRTGTLQVHSAPIDGGEVIQHTFHTEGNLLECLSSDGTRAIVRGLRDRAGSKPWRLMEVSLDRQTREHRLFDATGHTPAWSPDGKRILFCRGGEQIQRKGFRGSRASRIWLFDSVSGKFTCEVPGDFDARSPMWLPDASGFYFVSNSDGTANIWIKSGTGEPRQLTFHRDDGVINAAISADGSTITYRLGEDIAILRTGSPEHPRTIHPFTRETLDQTDLITTRIDGCRSFDFTPSLDQVVFSEQGELWWMRSQGAPSVRLTSTPAAEEDPRFSPDGKCLYYLHDDGLESRVMKAVLDDGHLQRPIVLSSCTSSISTIDPSPDGSRIAWIEDTGNLRTIATDGTGAVTVFPCWDQPTFCWSPDGRWLAVAAEDRHANRDIHLVKADGGGKPVNLTRHPAFDGSPRWSPDGRYLVFTSKRSPSREAELWRIDFGHKGLGHDASPAEIQRLADRAEKLEIRGIEPKRTVWIDATRLSFQSRHPDNAKVYSIDVRNGSVEVLASQGGIPIRNSGDGSLLWQVRRTPERWVEGKSHRFPIKGTLEWSRSGFLRLGFRRIWRTLGERFHDPAMNGLDWNDIRARYEPLATCATTSRHFDNVIGRMLGELNASHLVFQRLPWPGESTPTPNAQTLHTGIRFEEAAGSPGSPLVIHSVIPGSPASELPFPPQPGERVVRIAGSPVNSETCLERIIIGSPGLVLPMVLLDADNNERTVSIRCLSFAEARRLDAAARDANAAAAAARADLGYLRLPDMSRISLDALSLAVHRADGHRGFILDLRENGGGREADRMLAIFRQDPKFITRPRGGPEGYPADRLPSVAWPLPVAVLCNENTYSNSEIFCHAFREIQRGPLVGAATAGGVISAVMTSIPGLGKLQIPFRTWMIKGSGESLDLNGAQPTHPVPLGPLEESRGYDRQLEEAVKLLETPQPQQR